MSRRNNRILHVDGDSFFASCEIALDSSLEGRPVWVGGGRRGDGIVIAANRIAKKYGIKTGTACFEAKRLCPSGVLCKPHYDAYRELSRQMFLILEQYAPTLVPYSIDEGFLDFSTMDEHIWRDTTPTEYVKGIQQRIKKEVRLPVTAGLGNSAKMAKLATDAAKGVGFLEVKAGEEKEFLKDRPVQEMSGIGKNRQRSLAVFGAFTFGDVAKLPSMLLKQKFGIWGQQMWLFSSFGDMLRVPGSTTDLLSVKAQGGDVRIIYSPLNAVKIAEQNPANEVVFLVWALKPPRPPRRWRFIRRRKKS